MSELTLKLPETLHQQLTILATNEGVSLNQYIVLALTRQAAFSSMIQKDSETELERQQQELQSLVQKLGQASPSEIESILASRQQTEPEIALTAEVLANLQDNLNKQRTEADQQDLAAFSWQYAATIFPEDEEMGE